MAISSNTFSNMYGDDQYLDMMRKQQQQMAEQQYAHMQRLSNQAIRQPVVNPLMQQEEQPNPVLLLLEGV